MDIRNMASNQLLFTTVKIYGKDRAGEIISGTGFFYAFNSNGEGKTFNALITCRHVMKDLVEAYLCLHLGTFKKDVSHISMQEAIRRKVANLTNSVVYHKDDNVDLCGIPLNLLKVEAPPGEAPSPVIMNIPDNFTVSDDKLIDLTPIEDVIIIGFPAGLTDNMTCLPVIRRGITAFHPGIDFNGKNLGLLDITAYPGSSGSPVLIYNQGSYPTQNGIAIGNRAIFLGVLTGYSLGDLNLDRADLHLGAYVKARALKELKEEMLKLL
jgi:hypothetical protein